jgi:septum site-determining protein MinD
MLAVVGGKGGVGKSTTALGLGAALARLGGEPLVVDCDEDMPDCRHMAGLQDGPGIGAVAAGTPVEAVAQYPEQFDGMAVLTARAGDCVGTALAVLQGERHTILDAPAGAGPPAAVVLRAARHSLIVTTPTTQSIEDAVKTAATARSLSAPPLGVLVTMAETVPRGLEEVLGLPILGLVPTVGRSPLESAVVHDAYDGLAAQLQGNI